MEYTIKLTSDDLKALIDAINDSINMRDDEAMRSPEDSDWLDVRIEALKVLKDKVLHDAKEQYGRG